MFNTANPKRIPPWNATIWISNVAQPLILALDQGTTSTRAILYDQKGQALAESSRPLNQSYPHDGWVEHDAEAIFADSVAVLTGAVARSGKRMGQVAALGVTNQRETVVVWDKATGRPIHPAIVWQDRRTAQTCDELRARGAEPRVAQLTGLLLDPYFSATKIAWILDRVDGARARAQRGELLCGTIDCWLVWKLTGGAVHATDATNASRTLLMDLERQAWSSELCDLFRTPRAMLPEILDCDGDYGSTLPELVGAAIPIRGVAGDQQAALMGQGCVHAGEAKVTYGTGGFMLLHTGSKAPRSGARLLTTVAARVGGRASYALEGSIFIAGAAIKWINEELGVAGGPTAVEALAQQAKPDSGVVLVPAFTGLGAPYWDADARGAIMGLTRDAGLAEIAAAAFDATALQTRDLIEAMGRDAGFAFQGPVRIDGGMAKSRWFAQRLADLIGLGVDRAAEAEATARGAALFAAIGAKLVPDAEAAAKLRPASEAFSPALGAAERDESYARWRESVDRVRSGY
jgi:glycerol kinase